VSLALCLGLTGDQVASAEHHHLATELAERTNDLVMQARVHVNRSYHLIKQARAAYDEAARLAGGGEQREVAVRALSGLAIVLAADDPVAAAATAAGVPTTDDATSALLAAGWVALAATDPAAARRAATEAVDAARSAGQRAALAHALELRAAAEPAATDARAALREAHGIWTGAGAVTRADRVAVALGRLPGAGAEARMLALLAAERLTAANVLPDPPAGAVAPDTGRPEVRIRTLGRFEVYLDGQPVPPAAWQSRRARDLLRILVARRGRPVPRGELCELLWPDDDPARTGHRLSVLPSILRGVLDPGRAQAVDHYLVGDNASVAVDVTRVRVDVLEFLGAAAYGRSLLERDDLEVARAVLAAADREYTADLFADEPYEAWADGLREQARSARLEVLRVLADLNRRGGATGVAVELWQRLLEIRTTSGRTGRWCARSRRTAGTARHGGRSTGTGWPWPPSGQGIAPESPCPDREWAGTCSTPSRRRGPARRAHRPWCRLPAPRRRRGPATRVRLSRS
jgi:DNA-binding SARP family transcriptional activator